MSRCTHTRCAHARRAKAVRVALLNGAAYSRKDAYPALPSVPPRVLTPQNPPAQTYTRVSVGRHTQLYLASHAGQGL